jgi:hypothetical protein
MLYFSINERHGKENAAYYGRLCDQVFVNYPEQFTDVQGGYREYPGRYP